MALSSISITAPSSAEEGERVSVSARVTNISAVSYPFRVRIYAVEDIYAVPAPEDLLGTFEATIGSGAYKTISGSFTMPAWDTTVLVMVYRFINNWDFDNYNTKVVSSIEAPVETTFHLSVYVPSGGSIDPGSGDYPAYSTVKLTAIPRSGYQFTGWGGDIGGLRPTFNLYMNSDKHVEAYFERIPVEPVEEFEGTISRMELEYDESRANIPAYNIPEGQRGLVHIRGRNDMSTSQKLGIYWFVADPDGEIVEEYEDWEWGTTSPGGTHEFIGRRFDLDREKYTMWVELLMNQDDPEIVDRYIGDLCTVVVVVLEYKGSIARKELEYDETRGNIPVY